MRFYGEKILRLIISELVRAHLARRDPSLTPHMWETGLEWPDIQRDLQWPARQLELDHARTVLGRPLTEVEIEGYITTFTQLYTARYAEWYAAKYGGSSRPRLP